MSDLDSTIINICNYEYNYFLNKINIQGIGLSYKIINGYPTNIKCLCVMVNKKCQKHLLTSNSLIPKFYKGIPTDVIETGNFKTLSLTNRVRPVTGGYILGPAGIFSSGSYGALVKDSNGIYILSNNHVLAIDNLVPIGNPVLQPSAPFRGTSPNDIIATLDRFIPVYPMTSTITPENIVDCAIAKITDPTLVSSSIVFIGIPKGTAAASLGLKLQVTCSISGYLTAPIRALGATVTIESLGKKRFLYKNQILLPRKTQGGDSGALALTDDNYAVGLLFAGSSVSTLFNPIEDVLKGLNVTIVTE